MDQVAVLRIDQLFCDRCMRVLHTSPPMGPSYGGPFQTVRQLLQAELAAGLDARMFMPWSNEAEAHIPDWSPVEVTLTGRIKVPPLGWSPGMVGKLFGAEGDLLHTHGIWQHPSWVALEWKTKTKRPHVASVRGMLERWAWHHHAWRKRPVWWLLEERNLQTADLLHATSEQEAQALRDRGLTAPIAVIPNGVDLSVGRDVPRMRVSSSIRNSPNRALFLSRIHPKKGLPLLLAAWAKVRPENWSLEIVGPDEGGHRGELERLVVGLGLTGVVRFSGSLTGDAKEAAFRESDLFILPTHSENFGIAVAEAMAHRLPVITTHGAPWQLLETEGCGWWVPVNENGIAAALEDATRRSPEELAAMGERGRTVVAERFAWDGIAKQFVACYQWLLGKGSQPECVQ